MCLLTYIEIYCQTLVLRFRCTRTNSKSVRQSLIKDIPTYFSNYQFKKTPLDVFHAYINLIIRETKAMNIFYKNSIEFVFICT